MPRRQENRRNSLAHPLVKREGVTLPMTEPLNRLSSLRREIARLVKAIDLRLVSLCAQIIRQAAQNRKTVYAFGNGGSAALAMHLVTDLIQISQTSPSCPPFKAVALSDQVGVQSALANDYGHRNAFSRHLRVLAEQGDVLFGISTSGSSPNVLASLSSPSPTGLVRLGLTGARGGRMRDLCDHCLVVQSSNPFVVESVHLCFTQLLAARIRQIVGASQPTLKRS